MYHLPINTNTTKEIFFLLSHDQRNFTAKIWLIYINILFLLCVFLFYFLFFLQCNPISLPPFFIPSPAAVPGGDSPNSPTQAERLFLSSFGLTGGRKGSKASLVEEGCSEIWWIDMRLGVLTLLVLYLTAPLTKPV